jgi:hypothetical protein
MTRRILIAFDPAGGRRRRCFDGRRAAAGASGISRRAARVSVFRRIGDRIARQQLQQWISATRSYD